MDATTTPITLELSAREVHLLKSALRSFESAFGHDEGDLLHEIKQLMAKLDAEAPEQSSSTA
jgi:hypothetical protein